MIAVWPAALTASAAFAVPQFLVSNLHGPWLVDIVASWCSIVAMIVLLKFWKPKESNSSAAPAKGEEMQRPAPVSSTKLRAAWLPWILLSVLVFVWGVPAVKKQLNNISSPAFAVPGL